MLTGRDVRRLSDAIKQIHAEPTLDCVVTTATASLQELIACDWASVSLASPRLTNPVRFWSPYADLQRSTTRECAAFYAQHPNWRAFWQSLRPRPVQLMDVSMRSEAARLPIYHEVLRPLSIANLLGVTMPGSSMFALAVIRDRRRLFDRRDALVTKVVADHLVAAVRRLPTTARGAATPAEETSLDVAGNVEFVALDPRDAVMGESLGARAMLRRFFASSSIAGLRALPPMIRTWLAEKPASPVLCVANTRARLEVRRFDPHVGPGQCLVLYEERMGEGWALPAELTPREGEIARWVVSGKTNPEIASILGISRRTVEKHLESVFAKLGVPTRTALVTTLLSPQAGRV